MLAVLQIVDGFDLLAIAFAASSIAKSWELTPSSLGLVFASGSAGSILGAVFVGYLADIFGRKRIIITATIIIALSSLATAFMPSLSGLAMCRFVTGIGLGAMSPLVLAYNSEFFPERLRGRTSALLVAMLQMGQIIGGGIAAVVVPSFGWPAIFIIGSVAPAIMVPFLMTLPKSPVNPVREDATQLQGDSIPHEAHDLESQLQKKSAIDHFMPFRRIIADGRKKIYIALLVAMYLGASSGYFMNSWTPILLEKRGALIEVTLLCLSFYHGGGVVGSLILGWLMDRNPPHKVIFIAFLSGVPVLALLGLVPPDAVYLYLISFILGLVLPSGLLSLLSVSTVAFPNDVRVHVLASLTVVARSAAVLTPLVVGFLLTSGATPFLLFIIVAIFLAGAGASLLIGYNRLPVSDRVRG